MEFPKSPTSWWVFRNLKITNRDLKICPDFLRSKIAILENQDRPATDIINRIFIVGDKQVMFDEHLA